MQCCIIMTFVKFVRSRKFENIFNACPPWFQIMYILMREGGQNMTETCGIHYYIQ